MCESLVKKLEQGMTVLATAWIPQKPWIAVVSSCAGWYGRQVALTYGPGLIADYFINSTIVFMGNATMGKIVGAAVVAPIITPTVTPWVAVAAGFIMFYVASLICNLAQKFFTHQCCPEEIATS